MNEAEHVQLIHDMAKAIGTTPEKVADAMDELGFSPQLFNEGELPTPVEKSGSVWDGAFRSRLARDRDADA